METIKATQGAASKDSAKIANTFESAKEIGNGNISFSRPLQNCISTHIEGFAEAMRGLASDEVQQNEWDKTADEFYSDESTTTTPDPSIFMEATKGGVNNPFPTYHLPEYLHEVVKAVCAFHNADPAAAWASVLAVAGAALGKSCRGHFGSYLNWPSCWWVLNGAPGANKSPVTSFFIHPLRLQEREAHARYIAEKDEWTKRPKDQRGEQPRYKSLIADGITDEQFFGKCYDNGGKLFWCRDEFDGLINGLGLYNKTGSPAEAVLKTIYSQEDVSRETVGGRPMLIENPAVTMLTTCQPDMLARLMRKYIERGDGFFDRFLFVPVETMQPMMEETPIQDDIKRLWGGCVDKMLHNQLGDIYEDEVARVERLKARYKWQLNGMTAEYMATDSGDQVTMRTASLYPKAHYTLCRLAIVVARLRNENTITGDTMRYCVTLTDYLLSQQIATLNRIVEAGRMKPAIAKKDVARWLVDNTDYKKADIARFLFPDSKNPRQALNYLLNV